jgi:hypothetical protein
MDLVASPMSREPVKEEDLNKPWAKGMGETTMSMLLDLRKLQHSQRYMKDGFKDTEHVLKQQQDMIGALTNKLQEVLQQIASLTEKCAEQQEQLDQHGMVLFANTEDNMFGTRGLYVEAGEEKRFRRRVQAGLWAVGTTLAGLGAWLVNILVRLKGGG